MRIVVDTWGLRDALRRWRDRTPRLGTEASRAGYLLELALTPHCKVGGVRVDPAGTGQLVISRFERAMASVLHADDGLAYEAAAVELGIIEPVSRGGKRYSEGAWLIDPRIARPLPPITPPKRS